MSKILIENYMDSVWNRKQLDLIPKIVSNNAIIHAAIGDFYGSKAMQYIVSTWLNAFPDLAVTLNHTVADSEIVISHWTSKGTHTAEFLQIPASNNKVQYSGTTIYRVVDSMIVEYWGYLDTHNLRMQLSAKSY